MTDVRPHIRLFDTTSDLASLTDDFHSDIRSEGLIIHRVHQEEPPVYNAIELNDLPTLIMISISSIYFSAFLKRAGEDHFIITKRALARLAKKLFRRERDTAVVGSGKITPPALYSILFSIWTKAGKCRVKFVLKTRCSEIEYVSTVKAILKFLEIYYSGGFAEEYELIVDAISTQTQVVIAYDYDSDSLYLV